ncbi:MAG: hypothetical protein ACRC5H_09450 [Treponemataceae bacterium]
MLKNVIIFLIIPISFITSCNFFSDPSAYKESNLYVGVVSFARNVEIMNFTNNMYSVDTAIQNLTLGEDATAVCYATSTAASLLATKRKNFDYTYLVTFTDGFDNCSSSLYNDPAISQADEAVYGKAKKDIIDAKIDAGFVLAYANYDGDSPNKEQYLKQLAFSPFEKDTTLIAEPYYYHFKEKNDISKNFNAIKEHIQQISNKATITIPKARFEKNELFIVFETDKGEATFQFNLSYNDSITPFITIQSNAAEVKDSEGTQGYLQIGNLKQSSDGFTLAGTIENQKIQFSFLDLTFFRNDTQNSSPTKTIEIKNVKIKRDANSIDPEDKSIPRDVPKIALLVAFDKSESMEKNFTLFKQETSNFIKMISNTEGW